MTDINHERSLQVPLSHLGSTDSQAEQVNGSAQDSFRAGASAHDDPVVEGSDTVNQELPLIVWLRGDEPYADQFIIDAEQAMDILGIKRSRLTQISGKELRVGRIRIDRYIRPMYRLQDVQSYKNWTRATAAHTKSSEVIHEAAHKLESHADRLADRFDSSIKELSQSIQDLLETENHAMMSVHAEKLRLGFDQCGQSFEKLASIFHHSQSQWQVAFEKQNESLEKELRRQQLQIEEAKIQIEHMNQLLIDTQSVCKSLIQIQNQFHKDFANILATILGTQKESHEQLRHLKDFVEKQNSSSLEMQRVLPRRKKTRTTPIRTSLIDRE